MSGCCLRPDPYLCAAEGCAAVPSRHRRPHEQGVRFMGRLRRAVAMGLAGGLVGLGAIAVSTATAGAADGQLSSVGAASTAGNRTSHPVRIPTGVQSGDTLLLFLTTNSTT